MARQLYRAMATDDVKELLEEAIVATGADQVQMKHRPRPLSDNVPCFVASSLREYLEEKGMEHTRGVTGPTHATGAHAVG